MYSKFSHLHLIKMYLKMSSGNWWPSFIGLNVLMNVCGWLGRSEDNSALVDIHNLLYIYVCVCASVTRGPSWPGGRLDIKYRLTNISIPMLNIRRSRDSLIFNMGIPMSRTPGRARQAPGVWDQFVSYTRACETSAGCLRSIYPSLGMIQLFGDVTMSQWRHN